MSSDTIVGVRGFEVLDSRGNPTVLVKIRTRKAVGMAIAPAGASKSAFEAAELRDGGRRFRGLGVRKAVSNVNGPIARKLVGKRAGKQLEIDGLLLKLDGTADKRRLGANAVVATSIAVAKASAASQGEPVYSYLSGGKAVSLPVPFCNVVNGGAHAGNGLAFQEYMLAPVGARSFSSAMQAASECYYALRALLAKKFGKAATLVGDEGGFAPVGLRSVAEPLELMEKAVGEAGWGGKVGFALDVAATQFFSKGKYAFDGKSRSRGDLIDFLAGLARDYKLVSVEDGLEETDFSGFAAFAKAVPGLQVVGDDLFSTDSGRLARGIALRSGNALLLKPNQCGSLTEAVGAAKLAYGSGWGVMASHRSGDGEDAFIAELALGLGCGQLKSGAPARSERTCKYNALLVAEEELGSKARFSGRKFRRPNRELSIRLEGGVE